MARKRQLLLEHLETISGRVFEHYPKVVRDMIKSRSGIYVLYRKGRVYYVGLAGNLMGRLKSHLRDRHRGVWDRFSVYLTVRTEHIKELESLLLRILHPEGNRTGGRFVRSENLFSLLNRRIKDADADRRATILGGPVAQRRRAHKARGAKGNRPLAGIEERRIPLRGVRKGVRYRASLRKDGTIRFRRRIYESPSAAGGAAVKGPCNGWTFWHFKDDSGNWVPLRDLRG